MNPIATSRRRLRAPAIAATVLATLVFVLGACSDSTDDANDGGGDNAMSQSDAGASAEGEAARAPEAAAADGVDMDQSGGEAPSDPSVAQRAVISTATISLRSDDVAAAIFNVQKVVDRFNGEIADEKTEGGEEARRSRLVLRVPSAEFDDAIAALKTVGEVESTTRKSEDVTTTVIDTAARIRAQEESLRRVEVLLGRATSIRDIVAIEAQLTQRQAELDSLKSQQAFLADQTTLSTITVHVEQKKTEKKEKPDTDDAGFLSGLEDGWNALTSFGSGVATVAGAVLPFAVLFALLGVPTWIVVRRFARRRTPSTPAAAAAP